MIFPRFTYIYLMKRKSKVYIVFGIFKTLVENLFNCKIKIFQSNRGKEFDQTPMHKLFINHSVYFRNSCPNTQQKNGVAEPKHRHLLEMTRSFLIDASLPASFC